MKNSSPEDGSPIHEAWWSREWSHILLLDVLEQPPNSPDLNPIEQVWAGPKVDIKAARPYTTCEEELWELAEQLWWAIPQEYIDNLVESIPGRLKIVKMSRSGHTGK